MDIKKGKYEINIIKFVDLIEDDDKYKFYFMGVVWIGENEFVVVDVGNVKLKIYLFLFGKMLKKVEIFDLLVVFVWGEGIVCLLKNNKLMILICDFCL